MGVSTFRKKLSELNKRQLTSSEFINILLYSIIVIMPFIVVKGNEFFILQFPNEVMKGTYTTPVHYVLGKVAFIYIASIALFIMYLKGKKSLEYTEQKIAVIYLIFYFIATLFSINILTSILGNDFRYEGIIMIGAYILLFIMSSKYIVINEKLIKIVLISSSLMALYSVLQYYGIDPIQKWSYGKMFISESFGLLRHRNVLGSYISLFIPLSLGIYILKGGKFYYITSIILFSSMLCSLTRAAWVGFLAFTFIGLLFIFKEKKLFKRALIIFITFLIVFIGINSSIKVNLGGREINVKDRMHTVVADGVNLNSSSGSGRVQIWGNVLKAIKTSPILGSGPDTMKLKLEEENIYYGSHLDKSHNEFLELWLTGGLFTLLSYLLLVSLILYKLIKKRKDDNVKIMIFILVSYLVQSFFSISVILVAPIYWIFLGFFVKYINVNKISNNN